MSEMVMTSSVRNQSDMLLICLLVFPNLWHFFKKVKRHNMHIKYPIDYCVVKVKLL